MIPSMIVTAVCHVPYCCHPSYAQGYYDRDNEFYVKWDKVSESIAAVEEWLEEWVYGLRDRNEYWEKLGEVTHRRLRVTPRLSLPVNYGQY
jgi:glutaconate CoA-transferase subunit A